MKNSRLLLPAALALAALNAHAQAPQAAQAKAAQRSLDSVTVTAPRAHDPFSPFVYDVMGMNAPIRVDLVRAWFKRVTRPASAVAAAPVEHEALLTAQASVSPEMPRR